MKNKKGFTLPELLIVVAIIAVLVGISIPIFTSQLEKSREAADAANIRDAYAILMQEVIDDPNAKNHFDEHGINMGFYAPHMGVELKQKQDGWQDKEIKKSLIELFKDSPYIEFVMDYVGPTYGSLMSLSWEADPEDSHWKELGHDYCYVSLNGIGRIEKTADGVIFYMTH